jgi:tetratricopeptide (TPR) repeat protein
MQQAGVSNKGLATRVRAEAVKIGHGISPDHVSVRRWLDGMRPHHDTIRCIAAALSAKLNRRVTFAEIGFDSVTEVAEAELIDDGAQYAPSPEQAIDLLATLTFADLSGSPVLAASAWVSATAPSVIAEYLFAEPQRIECAGSFSDASADIAGRIRTTIRCVMDLDFQFGGGHTRKMLLTYWNAEIVPALQRRYPEVVARNVMSAAADAAQLLGWSAYDAGRHGAAQRYFVQGLRLAREANDRLMGGQILSNLSHQANYLGNFSEAIQFARAAQAATVGEASATVRAMFLAMEARALASIGDSQACAAVFHRAEQAFDQRNPGADPDWISYFDAWELAGEAAHCFRDLGQPRETLRFVEQAIDPVHTPARTRAFIEMVSAAGALRAGDLDQAVSIATDAVRLAGALRSSRYLQYVADLHGLMTEKNASYPSVRAFTELVGASYPTLALPKSA